jgi:hypothetical protein
MQNLGEQNKFCNGHAYNISNNRNLVHNIVNRIQEYKIGLNETLNALNVNDIDIICKYPFQWSFIPKGMPYYIYISDYNGNRCTYFIERKFKNNNTRIFMMEDLFITAPTETIIEGYIVPHNIKKQRNGKKSWSVILRDLLISSGNQMNDSYDKRWNIIIEYLEGCNISNKTINWKVLPLMNFPISIKKIKNIEEIEDISIQYVSFQNMSHGNKRYKPFILNYNSNIKNINQKEELDLNKEYYMNFTKGILPDVYYLTYNNSRIGKACVRTLKQSQIMKDSNSGHFRYHPIMKKWEIIV